MNCLTDDNIKWIVNHPIFNLKLNEINNNNILRINNNDMNRQISKMEKDLKNDIRNMKENIFLKIEANSAQIETNLMTRILTTDEVKRLYESNLNDMKKTYEINLNKMKIKLQEEGENVINQLIRDPEYNNIADKHLSILSENIKNSTDSFLKMNTEKMDKIIKLYDKTEEKNTSLQNYIRTVENEIFSLKVISVLLAFGLVFLFFRSPVQIIEKISKVNDIGSPVLGYR